MIIFRCESFHPASAAEEKNREYLVIFSFPGKLPWAFPSRKTYWVRGTGSGKGYLKTHFTLGSLDCILYASESNKEKVSVY